MIDPCIPQPFTHQIKSWIDEGKTDREIECSLRDEVSGYLRSINAKGVIKIYKRDKKEFEQHLGFEVDEINCWVVSFTLDERVRC